MSNETKKMETPSGSTWRLMRLGASLVLVLAAWGLRLAAPETFAQLAETLGRDADWGAALETLGEAVGGQQPLEEAVREVFRREEEIPVSALPTEEPAEPEGLGIPVSAPVAGVVTSPFGERVHPADGLSRFHYGVDIGAEAGAEVTAFADGTVQAVGNSVTYGVYVLLAHEGGLSTLYAHLESAAVTEGQAVARGAALGRVGETGNATGPCLHFELLRDGTYLDPAPYL